MHEISLVRTIFKTLEQEFPGKMEQIKVIHLKAGLLSNVQPILMENAFQAVLQDEPGYQHTRLVVEVLPIIVHCDKCNLDHEVTQNRFVCACGLPSNNIIQGTELLISRVELEEV
jgi:hydrogenase nickel incorporation protein HypA/HybF